MTENIPHPLAGQVRTLCRDIADAVSTFDDPASRNGTAAAIRAEADRIEAGAASVVVVGEKKRGKSSLINALVGYPGLLPVEADVATNVHLALGYAPEPSAEAVLIGRDEPVPITLAEIASYAALDPETGKDIRDDVRHVRVGIPSPLLRSGLVLVDTPGVGGLVSGHAKITLAALAHADALVFVVNGSVELTRSELTFLTEATERIALVLFVLTQIDKFGSWRQTLERNHKLLADHAPRYTDAPWFAVSSRAELASLAAREAGDAEKAAQRAKESDFAGLRAALIERVATRAQQVRMGNALHLALPHAERLVAVLERLIRSLDQDPALEEEVTELREKLRELQSEDAWWRRTLATGIRQLERTLRLGFQRSLNDLRALAEEKIALSTGADVLNELPGDIEAGIQGLWMELENNIRTGVRLVVTEISDEFETETVGDLSLPERLTALPELSVTADDAQGPLALIERAMPGWGAGRVAYAVLAMASHAVFLPVALGLGLMALLSGRRKRRDELLRARGDATKYLNRIVAELTTEIPPMISATAEELGERLGKAITNRVRVQRERLEAELAAYQSNLRATQETLARDRQHAQTALVRLRDLTTRGTALRSDLAE